MARLVAVLLLLGLLHPVLSIRCFRTDEFHKKIIDNQKACTAQFDPQDGTSSFSGLQKLPKSFTHQNDGCVLKTQRSRVGEVFDLWDCACFTDLCNAPISFKQFKHAQYSLA
ncbi:hypothetical protein GCK72_026027 [Caenorhabditis remanei]|uniref:Uncharacterized protein n=2 Tax=Caenorhabditis remanei TaxID=31234 RepID=E3MP50_CAERE|nr:hypothetical protein GCK72_026027 [Caenorhabditis remanei]EFP06412.1 hypothetical protein CRE_07660 [Caenorhabditis remanei]KAF1749559.1 hypothetical protein GCK72_026027 [Caenorhabditis remanei]